MRLQLMFVLAMTALLACAPAATDRPPAAVAAPTVTEIGIVPPPPARFAATADTLHGVVIPDPLRWLEDSTSDETRGFVAAQQGYTDSVLARLVGRDSLEAMVARAYDDTPTLDDVVPAAGRVFLSRWLGQRPSLFVVDAGTSRERLLMHADSLAARARGAGLRAISPSPDGRYVAVGTTRDGDEGAAIALYDVTTGSILPDAVSDLLTTTSGTRYQVTWLPDGSGFFYPRLWPGSVVGPAVDRLARGRQYLHRMGTTAAADVPVFGFQVSSNVAMDKADLPTRVYTAPGSSWLVASVSRVKENGTDWYAAPLAMPLTSAPVWTPIAGVTDRLSVPQLRGDTVFALARANGGRGAIVRRVLNGTGAWTTVVPERAGVITAFTVQQDGVYFTERDGGRVKLRRATAPSITVRDVSLPEAGAVRLVRGAPGAVGVTFTSETWATPPRWQRVGDSTLRVEPLGIDDGTAANARATITSTTLQARSRDGTMVPVSVVYGAAAMRGGALDGTAPLLIEGYGGYATATDPQFIPFLRVWTALGGVYAYAHVRGGGELGEAWHTAAMREQKQHSFDDMIGAIEALIGQRYTSAKRVVLMGTSFGANLPGMVLAQRPDLLGVALFEVGQPDEIRGAMFDPTAARNIGELGDLETAEGIRLLQKASPYHQVPDSAHLPAILVHSADGDYNFGSSMLAGKYVARLQAANRGTSPVLWVRTSGGHRSLFSLSPAWAASALSLALWQVGEGAYQPVKR